MTCIVGLVDKGKILMGSDSASVSGWDLLIRESQKIRKVGPFLMGFTGSLRQNQLLHYNMKVPTHPTSMSGEEYMSTKVVDEIRKCFKEGGFSRTNNEQEDGGSFLIGYNGDIYHIYADYQVGKRNVPFDAMGSGAAPAMGALVAFSKSKTNMSPRRKIQVALEASEFCNAGVRGPFQIKSMKF